MVGGEAMTELYRYVVRDREGRVVHVFKSPPEAHREHWKSYVMWFEGKGLRISSYHPEVCIPGIDLRPRLPTTNARAKAE